MARKRHPIQDRQIEVVVGLALFVFGAYLLWDAFDGRGKKMPWFAGVVMPF